MKKSYLLALSLLSASIAQAYEQDKTYHLTILHTNDHHGHFAENEKGEAGMAARKALIDSIRAEVKEKGGELLLLSAGDINTGTPESDMLKAEPDFIGMHEIGYDAMAIGNHEFDHAVEVLQHQMDLAKFPFLSANVKYKNDYLGKPYAIFERGGLKIGVLGLTTEDTAKLGNPEIVKDVVFELPIDTAKTVLKQWSEQEKPDIKIALTHLGYYHNENHGTNAPGDVTLARSLDKSALDLIIGGHTHDTVCVHPDGSFNDEYQAGDACTPDFQNGTWIMQAGEWGKYVGRADFTFKNGELKLENYQLLPVNLKKTVKEGEEKKLVLYGEAIQPDADLAKRFEPFVEQSKALLEQKVGSVEGLLDGERTHVRFFPTNFGRMMSDAHKARTKADLAITNSGGIRASLENGDVSYKNVLTVLPFGNTLVTVELSGEELLNYLNVVALKSIDSGAYAQYSSNLAMVVNRETQSVSDVVIDGQPLDKDKRYVVALNNYIAAGGDGYPVLKIHPTYVDTGFVDADALKWYIEQNSPIKADAFNPNGEVKFVP
ncbi:MAG: bifunctional UDP-sugar hydrolase/5'-nucleotidase UshA [Cardiobacteriaceae bacterium]|nr:bifunctional UDP-sugar hydrolase/5'-nucleotidase UshA [Cardiobacteriaceae bacterium]